MSVRLALTFKIFRGDQLVREETLEQTVIKIGKVPSAHLRIEDESVSRMHAILEVDTSGTVHVIDLGSTRGTFVNGQKINKAKLESGDAITVGAMRVEVAFKRTDSVGATAEAIQTSAPDVRVAAPVAAPVPPPVPARTPVMMATATLPAAKPLVALPSNAFGAALADDEPGAKAIEVAAMLGDSVVNVKHCIDPKSGTISRTTWGLFGAGAVSLVSAAVAFAVSVNTAAFNKAGMDYWVHVAKKPLYSFRPEHLSAGYDVLMFGGLAMGLAMIVAGLFRFRAEKRTPYYRIGTAPGVEMALEGAPAASFPLVAPSHDGDDFVFNYGAGMDGELILDGKSTSLAELAASGRARPSAATAGAIELPIPARAKIRARAGQTTFMVSAVAQPRQQAVPLLASLENRTLAYIGGSLVAHLAVWGILQTVPIEDSAPTFEVAAQEPVAIRGDSIEKEQTPPKPEDGDTSTGGQNSNESKAMALPEGASGKPDETATDKHIAIKDNHVDPQLARQIAMEQAREAGILGNVQAMRADFSTLTAVGDMSSAWDDVTFYGALFGGDAGNAHGSFGTGRMGWGRGGGCPDGADCGLIGTGTRFNTIGTGPHAGRGWNGPGGFNPNARRHEGNVPPPPVVGQPTGTGDLDKAIIRRYIKRNIDKIGYCYEHELLANPEIEGTITVSFFITPNGNVTGSQGTGFNQKVASCVADVVGGIEFPKPQGGGGVQVNYPFTFHRATGGQ